MCVLLCRANHSLPPVGSPTSCRTEKGPQKKYSNAIRVPGDLASSVPARSHTTSFLRWDGKKTKKGSTMIRRHPDIGAAEVTAKGSQIGVSAKGPFLRSLSRDLIGTISIQNRLLPGSSSTIGTPSSRVTRLAWQHLCSRDARQLFGPKTKINAARACRLGLNDQSGQYDLRC